MKINRILTVVSVIGLLAIGAAAQPSVPLSPADSNGGTVNFTNAPENFLQIAAAWGTSVNTNLAWPTNALNISTGARWLNNQQWANTVRAEKFIGSFAFDARINNQGIAGVVQSVQGGVGYNLLDRYDFRINAFIDGGYNVNASGNTPKSAFIDPEIWLQKLMTATTFAELGLDWQQSFRGPSQKYPGVDFDFGCTF